MAKKKPEDEFDEVAFRNPESYPRDLGLDVQKRLHNIYVDVGRIILELTNIDAGVGSQDPSVRLNLLFQLDNQCVRLARLARERMKELRK